MNPKGMFSIDGEPSAVTEARRHILSQFEDLEFYEEGHKYLLHGKSLNSASGISQRFIREPFDEQRQAALYAAQNGKTAAYWIQQWRQNSFRATSLGTKTHAFGESLGYLRAGHPELINSLVSSQYMPEYGFLAPIHPKEESVLKFMDAMPSNMHLVLNEAKVYSGKNPDPSKNLKERICGTFDMLYYYDGNGDASKAGFMVLDYKTNSNLYSEYNQKFHRTLLPPFDDMVEQAVSEYAIQLSLYSLMLEDIGVRVLGRRLVWLKEDGYEIIQVPDVSDRLRAVL